MFVEKLVLDYKLLSDMSCVIEQIFLKLFASLQEFYYCTTNILSKKILLKRTIKKSWFKNEKNTMKKGDFYFKNMKKYHYNIIYNKENNQIKFRKKILRF